MAKKKFVLSYYGEQKFSSEDECKEYMARWTVWMKGLEGSLVDPGAPLKPPKKVSSDGVTESAGKQRVSGYSVVKADTIEKAIEMVRKCPHLDYGTIDVAEAMDMKMY